MDVTLFDFEGKGVRSLAREGGVWFVLADVCRALGLSNPTMSAAALDADERARFNLGPAAPDAIIVSEAGLYTLILRNREATTPGTLPHRFRRWVTAEILPAIRKTGGYIVAAPDETPEALVQRAWLVLAATVERQKAQLAVAEPTVVAFKRIASTDGSLAITDAAKALQMQPKKLFAWLQANGWIYRRHGSPHYLGYQDKTQAGLVEHKVWVDQRPDGSEKIREHVRITARGIAKLSHLMGVPGLPFDGSALELRH